MVCIAPNGEGKDSLMDDYYVIAMVPAQYATDSDVIMSCGPYTWDQAVQKSFWAMEHGARMASILDVKQASYWAEEVLQGV